MRTRALLTILLAVGAGIVGTLLFQDGWPEDTSDLYAEKQDPLGAGDTNKKAVEIQTAFNVIFSKISPAVVSIYTEQKVTVKTHPFFREFFGQRPQSRKQTGLGSGFIINRLGYIVTNHHVAGQVDKITVQLHNGKKFPAEIVGTDEETDIALIKIKDEKDFPFVYLGDSDDVEVGDWALALGNPFGLAHTFTVGVVSAASRQDIGDDFGSYIQTDASINPGNSGGPLINIKGQVIGINRMIYSQSGGSVGIGFAIPINDAKLIIEELRKNKKIRRGWLGVQITQLTEDNRKELGLPGDVGVMVYDVFEDSPAKKAGIKASDIILSIKGKKVSKFSDLKREIFKTQVGKTVPIQILRNGNKKKIQVEIEELPKS